jgi:hypothetical protein
MRWFPVMDSPKPMQGDEPGRPETPPGTSFKGRKDLVLPNKWDGPCMGGRMQIV